MSLHQGPFQFAAPWGVCTPPVHRYLKEAQWVDDFWSTGKIRLAAFSQFRNHPDEYRKDEAEAWFGQELIYSPAAAAASTFSATPLYVFQSGYLGPQCYVLSASVRRDLAKFGTDFFTIADTTGFAYQIARHLPGFMRGWEGLCLYGHRRYSTSLIGADDAAAILKAAESGQPPPRQAERLTPDLMFAKDVKFAEELEYRFIWEVDHRVDEEIFVVVPQARGACVKSDVVPGTSGV